MYPVSEQYKTGIYATSRLNRGRVTFSLTDVSAEGDVTSIDTSPENVLSNKSQLNDNVRESSYKLVTTEPDRVTLDGSWSFADDNLSNNGQVGWISDEMCDDNGVFGTPQVLTVEFSEDHTSVGLTISFDTLANEYAADFTITAYNASDAVIATYTVTGNDQSLIASEGQMVDYRKLKVAITKWSVPNRRARVAEVDFGIIKVYSGDSGLVRIELNEELNLTSSSIPSPEFKFVVDNSSREFNILNPTGFYKSLQQQQKVTGEIGLELDNGSIEWVPLGNYLLWEWQSDEGSLTTTFYARTQLDLMASIYYENLTPAPTTLFTLATNLFSLCGITKYYLDPSLMNITTNGLVKKANCKDVLQMIAIAGCVNVYVTRDSVITVKPLPALTNSVDTISMNDQYAEPKINLDAIVKQISVNYFTNLDTSVAVDVVNSSVTTGDALVLSENTLIDSAPRATAVGNWILAQNNNRAIYTANWRGNQAQEIGDVVGIGNSYGQDKNAYVTKTDLTYLGYVQVTTEAKGVV